MSLLINSTTLGNIIITLGSVFLLYCLIRKFAWDQITGIFAARERESKSRHRPKPCGSTCWS